MYYQKVPITVFSFQLDDFPSVRKICNGKPVTYVYQKKRKQRKKERKNAHSVHLVFFRCLREIVLKTGAY